MDTSSWLVVIGAVLALLVVPVSLANVKTHRPGLGRLGALLAVLVVLVLAGSVVATLVSGYHVSITHSS